VGAATTVAAWADFAEENGFHPEYVASARRWAKVMQAWNDEHGRKTPKTVLPPMRV
jgi:hypothetical protein